MHDLHVEIIENGLTPAIYQNLHQAVGFKDYDHEDLEVALENTNYSVVLYDQKKAIGCARVLGDTRVVFFIKDVIVHPDYQHRGYGHQLMTAVLEHIHKFACKGAYIGLMATKGQEGFYEHYGFKRRPNDELGSGMILFYE